MKRLMILMLALLLAITAAACSGENAVSDEKESEVVSDTVISEDVSEPESSENTETETESEGEESEAESAVIGENEMTTAIQVTGDEQSGELPEIEGSDAFVSLFLKNPIDEYYLTEMENAASVAAMLSVTNETMKYWEAEVNAVYSELMGLMGEDSAEWKAVASAQKAFVNDFAIASDEIREEAQNGVSDGSMVNIEISYRLMLLYRGRAVELLCSAYNITGEVNVELIPDAAG